MKNLRIGIVVVLLAFAAVFMMLLYPKQSTSAMKDNHDPEKTIESMIPPEEDEDSDSICVDELSFHRVSSKAIQLIWNDTLDDKVSSYIVQRSEANRPYQWEQKAIIPSDGTITGEQYQWIDSLSSSDPQQYIYRVDIECLPDYKESASAGKVIPASNCSVCIDPGHYIDSSELEGEDLYGYGEGLFMLRLGLQLREELRANYGIDVIMTRETDDIMIDGYSNGDLDNNHLSLRGSYAAGQDLFISLHTNANLDNANGYPTCNQPISINKTLVFVNQVAAPMKRAVLQANAIGEKISEVNKELGLSNESYFKTGNPGEFQSWSDEYNDSLDQPGAVCYRPGDNGKDYYGVLRGASSVGVPGLIVEHGFHTVSEVRKEAMEGQLAQLWAEADAAGIAEGFDFLFVKAE